MSTLFRKNHIKNVIVCDLMEIHYSLWEKTTSVYHSILRVVPQFEHNLGSILTK